MRQHCMNRQHFTRYLLVLFLFSTYTLVHSEKFTIDPNMAPVISLPSHEAQQLKSLLNAQKVLLKSAICPDDKCVLIQIQKKNVLFIKNLVNNHSTTVDSAIFSYTWLTDFRWKNSKSLITIGRDAAGLLYEICIEKATGNIKTKPLPLTGEIVSLSTKGTKLLIARSVYEQARASKELSPILEMRPIHQQFDKNDISRLVPVATTLVKLIVINLCNGEEHEIGEIPSEHALVSIDWSKLDDKLALVHGMVPTWSRPENQSIVVQEALGLVEPQVNPFLTSNTLEIVLFHEHKIKQITLYPDANNTEVDIFYAVNWSYTADKLLVTMFEPSILKGRIHPIYSYCSASYYRLFDASGNFIKNIKRNELNSLYNSQSFVSANEIVINTFDRLTSSFFLYNIKNKKCTKIKTPEGSINSFYAFNTKRELLYEFNSFLQPFELFSSTIEGECTKKLTNINAEALAANHIQVNRVQFTLSHQKIREGYLIQPKGSVFPPNNKPLCIWQEGGPTSPMNNQWCGRVESAHNILPNFGIATCMVPLPGRLGFGKEFLNGLSDSTNFGQIDIHEQKEISQQCIDRGYTDHSKIGMYGMSYGGYFTSQTITTDPHFYAAANIQFSLINLFHEMEYGYISYLSYLMGCTLDNFDEFFKDSPLQKVDFVKTPTLVFTSSNDFLPSEFSITFYDKIIAKGVTTADLYYFLQEGHGLNYENSQIAACQAQIQWFRKYLAP